MAENKWSPFNPDWYQKAFDQFIYTADELFNTDTILQQGYKLPDADGSRSSVFRNEAVLNNSFNEKLLRETLKDIYLNSDHKLTASNHDNVHFYQFAGKMSDLKISQNTKMAEFVIPSEPFIYQKDRDNFKLSQYYRKWIKIEDVMNNWDIFKWVCLVFLNQKIFSEYELRIDDHEITLRFEYYDYWVKQDYPIYIYKMDTNASSRIKISKFLCKEEWDWKVPLSCLDGRIANNSRVIVAINKMKEGRTDGLQNIEIIGDNLEFIEVKDNVLDLSNISDFNRIYIESESTQYLWMSVFTPKFFHEYPILLPVDSIYRPYVTDFQPVTIMKNEVIHHVKINDGDKVKQVYVDLNGRLEEEHDGWKQMIRPIVLSDAFDKYDEPYDSMLEEINNLRDLTVEGADKVEKFRFFLFDYTDEMESIFTQHLDDIMDIMDRIREAYHAFLDKLHIEYDKNYEYQYKKFIGIMEEIRNDGIYSIYLQNYRQTEESEDDYFFMVSPLIYIPRELADRYFIVNLINSLTAKDRTLWENINNYLGKVRFQRPVDATDFWTFEYYGSDRVWRPYPLKIEKHFPDVYIPMDGDQVPELGRIFKTFFFYSDTINVREEANDIIRATPSWDEDVKEYHFEQEGIYRDVFMEKFYWMGVRAIYEGILYTQSRWEAIEYIIDNDSYERFNELFLNTMDPYFKLGLASYLKNENFGFPFDAAVEKLKEAVTENFIGYKKITNFEIYLNKTWIPSYFDHIVKIMDSWDWPNRLFRRPRSSFDTERIIPILIEVQESLYDVTEELLKTINWILEKLAVEGYNLESNYLQLLKKNIIEVRDNMAYTLEYTKDLDLEILSVDDINFIIDRLRNHIDRIEPLREKFDMVFKDATDHNVYAEKRALLNRIKIHLNMIPEYIEKLSYIIQDFDIEKFMKITNDLDTYFKLNKENPDDKSFLYKVNQFDDPWSVDVKEKRNKMFQSTAILYGIFIRDKSYSVEEVLSLIDTINLVKSDTNNLRDFINEYYTHFGYEVDQSVFDKLEYVEEMLETLIASINRYTGVREEFMDIYNAIKSLLEKFDEYNIGNTEKGYRNEINQALDGILIALSYIAGKNNKDEAEKELAIANKVLNAWFEFVDTEEEIFEKIFSISKPPIEFLVVLEFSSETLEALIEYMDTVNNEYQPDKSWPTYSDIYEVEEVELLSGGLRHEVGQMVYIPNLGSYKIVEVSGNIARASSIEEVNYRTTTFRDPLCQSNPYDSITDGIGMGITVKSISSKHTRIMNDNVIKQFIMKLQNGLHLLKKDSATYNPRNNDILEVDLNTIREIKTSWDEIVSFYKDYMSEECRNWTTEIVDFIQTSIDPCNEFIKCRSGVNADKLISDLEKFISSYYRYAGDNDLRNEYFYYCDNLVREAYNSFFDFYQNGTGWSDGIELRGLTGVIERPITLLMSNVINKWESNEQLEEIKSAYDNIICQLNSIRSAIKDTTNSLIDVNHIIDSLEKKLETVPELQKDLWYNLKFARVAIEGSGYKVGDIVEIIPELPTDSNGNYIHGMDDIIFNDVILFQVTKVDEDKVVEVKPLLNYALPYMIWGVRETKTRVGTGEGLILDVYTYEIDISDSTLFDDPRSRIALLPLFDENDMFTFKFENIHDLDVKYEVFIGGKQITNFVHRHNKTNDPLHPENIDTLYVNANEVMDLKNSSIFIKAENYFIYKIDDVIITDPGAGYCEGQDICLDTEHIALRLKVAEILLEPYKGISKVSVSGKITSKELDPSTKDGKVVRDSMNNIDDEYNVGYYDEITKDGIQKQVAKSVEGEEYLYTARRFDNMDGDNRNKTFMYSDINMPAVEDAAKDGDPDYHWYLGSRIDNSQHPMKDERVWNGLINLYPPTDPFIPDNRRIPTGLTPKGEYQDIISERIHLSPEEDVVKGDLVVSTYADIPKHINDYPDGHVGSIIIVENDETHNGHRMAYRIRTFIVSGFFVYDFPDPADQNWTTFKVNFMDIDFYPDLPTMKAQFPNADWRGEKSYREIEESITDGDVDHATPEICYNTTSFIHDLTVDDLSVFNWTTKEWEDLHDTNRWRLEVIQDDEISKWGFTLYFLQEGIYSYDMRLYLNKIPETQLKNALLKRNAVMDVMASILSEVNIKARHISVNTGRHVRIRKLFPYEQKESFTIGYNEDGTFKGYEIDFKLANYIHFKNELHLEDVKVFNRSAGRFENILDTSMFEVRFKDPKAVSRGYETQTRIVQSIIGKPGYGFIDGEVWGWNAEYGIHLFGRVTADYSSDGHIISFEPVHCPNSPEKDISLEFCIFQHSTQSEVEMAVVLVEFHTEKLEVYGDGYIHKVTNRLAPLPKEFKVIVMYDLFGPQDYDIIISKTKRDWVFVEPKWLMAPTFHLDKYNIQTDRLYVLTDNGRFPIVNPATNKPTLHVVEKENGTDVTFLNLYRRYEHLHICSTPYPMRSVYVQRKIPQHGFIDLKGKINKPLNKKYFEFWVNGKLMYDEVTIISPTKIFLHGLTSLKNLEILEINRDSNEYFSDSFLDVGIDHEIPHPEWNFETYLDKALEGNLEGDNYSTDEQAYLLSPVWPQVPEDHPEYKNYPPNVDVDDDILLRTNPEDYPINDLEEPLYQFLVINQPTIEGKPIVDQTLTFSSFGFKPITNDMLIDMMNEEWKDEIEKNPYMHEHSVLTDEEWYGMATRLYDEYGILVHTLDESVYHVTDVNLLKINTKSKISRILKNSITYDLT